MAESRFCAFDDQPVRELVKGDKVWGRVQSTVGGTMYVHSSKSEDGVPPCKRPALEEHQTYTQGDSSGSYPTEPQY